MKRNVISVGLAVVFCAGALVASKQVSIAQPDAWFVQDFEGIEPGRYQDPLTYPADGVDVTLSGINGPFYIVQTGLGGLFGEQSLGSGQGKKFGVLIEFSDTIHGIELDLMSECGRISSVAVLTCYDEGDDLVLRLTNKGRPCNQLSHTGASILGERIIKRCRLSGIADNLIVNP